MWFLWIDKLYVLVKKICFIYFLFLGFSGYAQSVTHDYVEENKEIAISLMSEHHVPASIILGVAIHESASGRSKIAQYLNNHFGIKGPNNSTQIKSAYRGFDTVEDSYKYFIGLLHTHPKFRNLFDKYDQYDYRGWAKGMQRGGYAASSAWSSQVIAIIKKYQLYQYDNRPEGYVEPVPPVAVYKIYKVKKGDTLGAIAKKYKTTVKNIMRKNNLKSTVLRIGQKLKI